MKISTKGRYALRFMADLAMHYNMGYIPLKEIAVRQDISEKYMEQIISVLSRAGLVKGIRGNQGGYKLIKAPEKYTVGDILRTIEGSLAPVDCLTSDINGCSRSKYCPTLFVWEKLKQAVDSTVDGITLQDIIERAGKSDFVI